LASRWRQGLHVAAFLRVDRIPAVTQVAAEAAQFWWSYLVHVYNPVIQLAATLFTNQA